VAERTMAEVTNELMYELLKRVHADISSPKDGLTECRQELVSIRLQQLGMQNDIHNIYSMFVRSDQRLERIERRLELRELAEPQKPFDPAS
jgi:hypothetical protein